MATATMTFFTVDTLQFSKRLQKAGLEKKISEELAEAIKDTQTQSIEGLATKHDVALLKKDIQALDQKFGSRFELIDQKFESLENRLTIKIFFMLTAAVGIITWLDKVVK